MATFVQRQPTTTVEQLSQAVRGDEEADSGSLLSGPAVSDYLTGVGSGSVPRDPDEVIVDDDDLDNTGGHGLAIAAGVGFVILLAGGLVVVLRRRKRRR